MTRRPTVTGLTRDFLLRPSGRRLLAGLMDAGIRGEMSHPRSHARILIANGTSATHYDLSDRCLPATRLMESKTWQEMRESGSRIGMTRSITRSPRSGILPGRKREWFDLFGEVPGTAHWPTSVRLQGRGGFALQTHGTGFRC